MAHFFGYIVTASLAFYLGRFRADRSQIRIKYIQALLLRSRRVIRLLVKQLEIATRRRKKIVTMSDADRRAILRLMNTLPAPVSKRFLFIIKWKTAVRWHKKLSKWFHRVLIWNGRRKSRNQVSKGPGRPPRYLEEYPYILKIVSQNLTWGAQRIHSEMKQIGREISLPTLRRYLARIPEYKPRLRKWRRLWTEFLSEKKHLIAATDFLVIRTFFFKSLYIHFVIGHGRRLILHFNVTYHPTEDWVIQQFRNTFDGERNIKYLIMDRDAIFSRKVRLAVRDMGIKVRRTSVKSPWQNGIAERFVKTVRRELTDHAILPTRWKAFQILAEFILFYNKYRPHMALGGDSPLGRPVSERPFPSARLIAIPVCGEIQHRYEWEKAA